MSTIYENTLIVNKDKYDDIKETFESNGCRVRFDTPIDIDGKTYMVTFDSNGSLYDNYDGWFKDSLNNIIGYEENCIECDPYFTTYINGEWHEDEKSVLRDYYNVPQYSNE